MAQGANLKKALEWFDRAVRMEEENKITMMENCIKKMLEFEKLGLAAGESYD